MAYLDIIPLADAKNYLKIDDSLSEDDNNITRMIKVSLMEVERMTNIHLIAKSKTYYFSNFCALVYDYPINTLTSPTTAIREEKTQYSIYVAQNITDLQLVLNIGYANVADVPQDLIEVAYEMIDIMYYNKEGKLSNLAKMTLDGYKRFII